MPGAYGVLDRPLLYRLLQSVLAPGADAGIARVIASVLSHLEIGGLVLDVGCGPVSRLWKVGLEPIGLDRSSAYATAYDRARRGRGVVGDAAHLPFADGVFASAWTVGLMHHLDDGTAGGVLGELRRVSRPDGHVVVLDAVMPRAPWRRPLAYALRRLDRGRFVRGEPALLNLLHGHGRWQWTRHTYSYTALELIVAWSEARA